MKSSRRMRPTHFREYWEYTVEKVAVNAVMAARGPSTIPVILALAATGVSARRQLHQLARHDGVVNGPIRREIAMKGASRDGPHNHARRHRPRLRAPVAEPPGRLGARPHLHGLPGQQLRLQQRDLRGE